MCTGGTVETGVGIQGGFLKRRWGVYRGSCDKTGVNDGGRSRGFHWEIYSVLDPDRLYCNGRKRVHVSIWNSGPFFNIFKSNFSPFFIRGRNGEIKRSVSKHNFSRCIHIRTEYGSVGMLRNSGVLSCSLRNSICRNKLKQRFIEFCM